MPAIDSNKVTVTEETFTRTDLVVVVTRYIVTSSTGYRATLPACGCERTPCPVEYGHGKAAKGAARGCDGGNSQHCHASGYGYHRVQVDRYAAEVAKTYEYRAPRQRSLPGTTALERRTGRLYVPCPVWPVVDDLPQSLPAPCDCESCHATLALVGRAA